MSGPGSAPPTSASSPALGSAGDPPADDLDSIASKWKELAKSDQGNVLPSLLSLTEGGRHSPTVKLRDEKAMVALNFLDKLFTGNKIPKEHERNILIVMRALAYESRQVPTRYLAKPGELTVEGDTIYDGGAAYIRKGTLDKRVVAVRTLRPLDGTTPLGRLQLFCKESIIWMRFSHPRLLELIAVDINFDTKQCYMISEMMINGNIRDYINHHSANRLQLLCDAAEGLQYLHTNDIVHGDIKGSNILINNGMPTRACLADFGLSTLTPSGITGEKTTITTGGTEHFMAPELLDPAKFGKENNRPTQPGDIYAFGMTIYEVLTGRDPFHEFGHRGRRLADDVVDGTRPGKPSAAESIGFGRGTWELVEECWVKDSTERPTTKRVLEHLSSVVPFSTVVDPTILETPLKIGQPATVTADVCLSASLQTLRRRLDPPKQTGPFFAWYDFKRPAFNVYVPAGVINFLGVLYLPDLYRSERDFVWSLRNSPTCSPSRNVGRVTSGILAEKFGVLTVTTPLTILCAVMTYIWPFATTKGSLIVIAIIYGFFSGAYFSLLPIPLVMMGEMHDAGRRSGTGMTVIALGAIAGPPISGAIAQATGGFKAVGFYAGSCILAAVFLDLTKYLMIGSIRGKF